MLSFLFYILLLCLSLASWVLLTLVGYSLLRYRRRSPALLLSGVIVTALWGVTTFNVWYEGLVMVEHISLISSHNSWAFVLITPLFYLYYRLLLTGSAPGRWQWVRHLFVPGLLLVAYIGATLVSSVPDKFVYSWREFLEGWHSWWGLFRISCYVLLAGQLAVYLPRLFGAEGVGGKQTSQALYIRREMMLVLAFCGVALLCMLTSFYLLQLLYALSVVLLAGYLFSRSPFYRLSKRRLGRYLIPDFFRPRPAVEEPEPHEEPLIYLTAEKEVQLEQVLGKYLHDPHLTIGLVAREVASNQTYLSRYFNRQRGVSFTKYVCTRRLDEAEQLLLHTDLIVTEISEQVGFQTLSAFYKAFGDRHGLPPAQWRKQAIAEILARTPEPTQCGE